LRDDDDLLSERRLALAEMKNSDLWRRVLKPSLEGRLAEISRRTMQGRTLAECDIRRNQHHYEVLSAILEDPVKWFLAGLGD
jgi:hypothetical protein